MNLDFFEKFWLEKARSALALPANVPDADALEKIRADVSALSDLFTTARPEHFRDYMSNARLLAAYGLFFFPQSFARAQFAISRLLGFCNWNPIIPGEDFSGVSEKKVLRVLDFGSGSAPCGLAIAGALRERFPNAEILLTAVDRSRVALDALAEMPLPEWLKISTQVADLRNFAGTRERFDVVALGWSLNEIVPADVSEGVEGAIVLLKKLAGSLAENGALVVLEPALKSTAERLQHASDYFALNPGLPFWRLAPELGEHACPLLAEGISWNHEVRKWDAPASLEFLNRKLFREIQVLKFSWVALGKRPGDANGGVRENLLRLVSPLEITKPALRFSAVSARGEKIQVEIPTRGMCKNECKKFAAEWERGDIARVSGTLNALGTPGSFRLSGTIEKAG